MNDIGQHLKMVPEVTNMVPGGALHFPFGSQEGGWTVLLGFCGKAHGCPLPPARLLKKWRYHQGVNFDLKVYETWYWFSIYFRDALWKSDDFLEMLISRKGYEGLQLF